MQNQQYVEAVYISAIAQAGFPAILDNKHGSAFNLQIRQPKNVTGARIELGGLIVESGLGIRQTTLQGASRCVMLILIGVFPDGLALLRPGLFLFHFGFLYERLSSTNAFIIQTSR